MKDVCRFLGKEEFCIIRNGILEGTDLNCIFYKDIRHIKGWKFAEDKGWNFTQTYRWSKKRVRVMEIVKEGLVVLDEVGEETLYKFSNLPPKTRDLSTVTFSDKGAAATGEVRGFSFIKLLNLAKFLDPSEESEFRVRFYNKKVKAETITGKSYGIVALP